MAESGLSLGYADLQSEIGDFLGIGRTAANFSTTDDTRVDSIIRSGLRTFYSAYDWGFLKVVTTLTTNAPYNTGTVSSSSTTVTLTGGTWPSWAASGEIVVDNVSYTVASRTSDSVIVLDTAPSTAFSSDTYELRQRDYDLPDNFGGPIIGDIHHQDVNVGKQNVKVLSQADVRDRRARSNHTGAPVIAATRLKTSDRTNGQRHELLLWPDPDAAYTLQYRYFHIQEDIDATNPYPLGGGVHAETIKCACLAQAEAMLEDRMGIWEAKYQAELIRSIRRDQAQGTAQYIESYGQVTRGEGRQRIDDKLTGNATVNGSVSDA